MVVLSEADTSQDDAFDVEAAIADFLVDPEQLSLELPYTTTGQRRRARKIAEDSPELKCESYGFGPERQLHIFKKGFTGDLLMPTKSEAAVNVKNTFIDDWMAPEDGPEPVVFKEPSREAIAAMAIMAAVNGHELPLLPKELQPEVRRTFIHIEGGDSMDKRIVQTMPRDMFRQHLNHEVSTSTSTSTGPSGGFAIAEGSMCTGGLSTLPPSPSNPATGPTPATDLLTQTEVPLLKPGTQIMVDGLVRAPAFNGLAGVVQFYEQETNRYSVLLSSVVGVQRAKIKGENLRLIGPPPYCAEAKEPPMVRAGAATPLRLTALV